MSMKAAMLSAQNAELVKENQKLQRELAQEKQINTGLMEELQSANRHIDRLEAVGS